MSAGARLRCFHCEDRPGACGYILDPDRRREIEGRPLGIDLCLQCSETYPDRYGSYLRVRTAPGIVERDWWAEAVRQRAEEAEAKVRRGEKADPDDVVAVALAHPEAYEVVVRLRVAEEEVS